MQAQTNRDLWWQGPVNRYLLCAVLSQQTRRLGCLIPEMQIPELIGVAWRNWTDHKVEIQMDGNVPDVIREEAVRMFPPTKLSEARFAFSHASLDRSQTGDAVSTIGQQGGTEGRPRDGGFNPYEAEAAVHISVGSSVDSTDSCCNLPGFQRNHSMSNANGTDRMRLLQLRALAENLYLLATRHRENGNYIVAHALYGRALATAQGVNTPEHKADGKELVTRIHKDQQAVFEMLRSGESSSKGALLEKAQKLGQ